MASANASCPHGTLHQPYHRGGATLPAVYERRPAALSFESTIVVVGLFWGGGTAFVTALGDNVAVGQTMLLLATLALLLFPIVAAIPRLLSVPSMLFMLLHSASALASALANDSDSIQAGRYLLLSPAFLIMGLVAERRGNAARNFMWGLMVGGVALSLFHLDRIEWGALTIPEYRLSVFLNPNGVGFIAGATAVALLALTANSRGTFRALAMLVAVSCLLVTFATKSRTALIASMAGVTVLGLASWRRWSNVTRLSVLVAGLSVMALLGQDMISVADAAGEALQVWDPHRDILTATGRFEIWTFILEQAASHGVLLGCGPGELGHLLGGFYVANAHNGVLRNLAEVGLVGALPLLIVTAAALRGWWNTRGERAFLPARAIFAVGLVESLTEDMFYSMGNPASLMFLLAAAVLIWSQRASPPVRPFEGKCQS
jgi:O-antigen ligase